MGVHDHEPLGTGPSKTPGEPLRATSKGDLELWSFRMPPAGVKPNLDARAITTAR
jgi:hypothetical protein